MLKSLSEPKISIIVPIYNAENSLDRCMHCIYAQSFNDYEIILVNDGSTDSSLALCNEYAEKDKRITVIDKENGGSGSARNEGIKVAKGKYLYFLDSDDVIDNRLLEIVFFTAEKNQSDLVVFSVNQKIVDSVSGDILSETSTTQSSLVINSAYDFRSHFSYLYYEGILFGGPYNKLFVRSIITDNNILFPDLRRGQDELFNIYYYRYVTSCSIIPDVLYTYYAFDEKLKNKKYRLSYFETTTLTYWKEFFALIEGFGLDDEYTMRKVDHSFVYYMKNAILLAWNPLEKFDKRRKKDFINYVCSNDFIRNEKSKITIIPDGYEKFWRLFLKCDINGLYSYIETEKKIAALKTFVKKIIRKK